MSKRKNEAAAAEASSGAKVKEMDGKTAKEGTVTKAPTEPKTDPDPERKKTASRKMYVGPTITGFAIQNRVYTGIPDTAEEKLKERPELGNLFIEVLDYPKANKMLRERTGYIYSAYMKALELRK